MNLFWICFIEITPFAFLCFYPFEKYFRFSRKKTYLITLLIVIGAALSYGLSASCLSNMLTDTDLYYRMKAVVFILILLTCFFWYCYAIKTIMAKKLFIFFFALLNAFAVDIIYNYFMTFRLIIRTEIITSNPLSYDVGILLVLCVYVPILLLFFKYCYLPIEESLNAKESTYLTILSVFLSVLVSYGILFFDYNFFKENPLVLFLFIFLMVAVAFIYFIFFRMYYVIHKSHQIQQEAMQMQHQIQLRDEQYQRIYDNMESSRKMRHDLKHHMLTIKCFLDDGDIRNANEYLEQYFEDTRKYEVLKFCDSPIVNMLVSHYHSLAKENNMELIVRINIPKELPIQTPDISVLLRNLLENAINGALTVPVAKRSISLNILCSGKMLAITVDNSFDGNVKQNGTDYISTKPEHGGLGLKSLADIAEKYNGGVEFSHDADEDGIQEFHASVMLGLSEN